MVKTIQMSNILKCLRSSALLCVVHTVWSVSDCTIPPMVTRIQENFGTKCVFRQSGDYQYTQRKIP
jgi:hypothetical protein